MPPLQPFAMPGPPPAGGGQEPGYPPPGQAYPPPGPHYPPPGQAYPPPGTGYPPPAPGYGQPAGYPPAYGPYAPDPGGPGGGQGPLPRDPALAEWWQRLLARLVDGVVISILLIPLWLVIFVSLYSRMIRLGQQAQYANPGSQAAFNQAVNHMFTDMFGSILLLVLITSVVTFGYDWLQHALWGRTIGKRVLGTRVVTADTRSRISVGAAGGRAAVYALPGLVPTIGGIFALINELWLLWDPQRQCLHDKAAKTVVVKADMVPEATVPAPRPSPQ